MLVRVPVAQVPNLDVVSDTAPVTKVFFQNITGEDGKGMSRLVKKTRERVKDFRDKHLRRKRQQALGDEAPEDPIEVGKPNASSAIPRGIWPVSIRNEDGAFETIKHPGFDDGSVELSVPRFWAEDPVAIHQNKLMTRERALSIGTCITKDSTGSNNRGDKCPLNERTIFVASKSLSSCAVQVSIRRGLNRNWSSSFGTCSNTPFASAFSRVVSRLAVQGHSPIDFLRCEVPRTVEGSGG